MANKIRRAYLSFLFIPFQISKIEYISLTKQKVLFFFLFITYLCIVFCELFKFHLFFDNATFRKSHMLAGIESIWMGGKKSGRNKNKKVQKRNASRSGGEFYKWLKIRKGEKESRNMSISAFNFVIKSAGKDRSIKILDPTWLENMFYIKLPTLWDARYLKSYKL